MIRINEIFLGMEGEGLEIGIPKVFIRTQGCNVGCKCCDTLQALNPYGGTEMQVDDILDKVLLLSSHGQFFNHITITGGSPLNCDIAELTKLIQILHLAGFWVAIEESGQAYNEEIFKLCDFLSIDAKSPSTGVVLNGEAHNRILNNFVEKTQIKIIVANEEDLDFAEKYCHIYGFCKNIVITPCWNLTEGLETLKARTKWIHSEVLKRGLNVRVILQMHKVIYGCARTGV
jgi:7-carboxy-7-deazaguanine synthase